MGAFEKALAFTLRWEGGYVNDPNDPGKETNFGISRKAYPHEDIKNMTKARATEIYRRDFWNKIGGDELPDGVGMAVFDFAVNSGVRRAVKALQTGLNLSRVSKLTVDGRIGPKTVEASQLKPPNLINAIQEARGVHFKRLGKSPRNKNFVKGWANRLNSLTAVLGGTSAVQATAQPAGRGPSTG